jgi:hypothetical protein
VAHVRIPGITELAQVELERQLQLEPDALLGDDVGPALLKWGNELKASADRGQLKRALSASAGASIELLNSASDGDAAGVFGIAHKGAEPGISVLPRLTPGGGFGWLKYRFGASLRAQAAADLGLGTLKLDAGRGIEYAMYRRHPLGEPIAANILSDLRDLPSALEADDIVQMGQGDALTLQLPGRLSLKFELDESLFASSNLRPISSVFGITGALLLQFQSGFTFSAELSITDDLRLCFVGRGAGMTHVSLRKADQSSFTAKVGAAVAVGFSRDTQAVLLERITQALFGTGVEHLDAVLARLAPEQLLAGESALVQQLAERLGISGNAAARLDAVRDRLAGWKARLTGALTEVLKTRIELGFNYEYSRIASSGSLLEAVVDAATLRELHPSLLKFDLGPALDLALLDETRQEATRRLQEFVYLHERRVTRIASRGFTLGIGKWLQFSGKFSGSRGIVEQADQRGQRKLAWISTRAISSALNDTKAGCTLTFRADTEQFLAAPRMGDLKFALALESMQQQLQREQLRGLLDLAALWGVLPSAAVAAQWPRVMTTIPHGVEVDTLVSLRVSDRLVRATALWLRSHTNNDMAPLLARSLPYWQRHDARATPELREQAYAEVFRQFLIKEGALNFKPERMVRKLLAERYPTLAQAEARPNSPRQLAFVGNPTRPDAIGHRAIGMRLDVLRIAFSQLLQAPELPAGEMDQVLDLIYAQQKSIAERSFTARFFGALLAEVARTSGYADGFVASATFTWKDAQGECGTLLLAGG